MLCTQVAIPELGTASEGPAPLDMSMIEGQEVGAAAHSPEQAGAALALGGPSRGPSAGSGSKATAGAAVVQRGRKQAAALQLSAGTAWAMPAAGAGATAAHAEVPPKAALQRTGADPAADNCTTRDLKAPSAAPQAQVLSALASAAAVAGEAPPACALGKWAWLSAPDQSFRCAGTAYLLCYRVCSLQASAALQEQQHRSQVANTLSLWFVRLPP